MHHDTKVTKLMSTHWLWVIVVAATVSCTKEWHCKTKFVLKIFWNICPFTVRVSQFHRFQLAVCYESHRMCPMWCLQSGLHASTMTQKSHNISPHWFFFSAHLVRTQYCSTDSQSRSAKWQLHILAFSSFILFRHQEVLMCPTMCWNINCIIAKGGCAGNFTKKWQSQVLVSY